NTAIKSDRSPNDAKALSHAPNRSLRKNRNSSAGPELGGARGAQERPRQPGLCREGVLASEGQNLPHEIADPFQPHELLRKRRTCSRVPRPCIRAAPHRVVNLHKE